MYANETLVFYKFVLNLIKLVNVLKKICQKPELNLYFKLNIL